MSEMKWIPITDKLPREGGLCTAVFQQRFIPGYWTV